MQVIQVFAKHVQGDTRKAFVRGQGFESSLPFLGRQIFEVFERVFALEIGHRVRHVEALPSITMQQFFKQRACVRFARTVMDQWDSVRIAMLLDDFNALAT